MTRLAGEAAFVPPGQTGASGLAAAYAATAEGFRSTAVALVPMNDWLVKVRYSSPGMEPAALLDRTKAVLAALAWPTKIAAGPPAAEVVPCTTALALGGESVAVADEGPGLILGAALGIPLQIKSLTEGKDGEADMPRVWCRDTTQLPLGAVYRANNETDGYLIAFSDAGRAVRVEPNFGAALAGALNGGNGKSAPAPNWSVHFIDMGATTAYPSQDRLPPPEQATRIIDGPYTIRTATWGVPSIEVNSSFIR